MNTPVTEKIEAFFAKYPAHHYDKGQLILLAGDEPPAVFHIEEGRVRQYAISFKGDEVVLNVFKSPAFFPMAWALNGTPNNYFYAAEAPTTLRTAPAPEVVAFLKENPDIAFDLLSRVFRGAEGMLGRMAHLMAGTARIRLLHELLIECRRFGTQQPDKSYAITLNEQELGGRAGLTRETVNREMRTLKKEGFVRVHQGHITVVNVERVEHYIRDHS